MGGSQSITWSANAESLSGSGDKVVLSDPIEGADADKFWQVLEQLIRQRDPVNYEKSYESKVLPDGSILATVGYDGSQILGPGKFMYTHLLNKLDVARDEVVTINYGSDEKLSEDNKLFTTKLKVWRDPFRIEYHTLEHAVRRSGPFMMLALKEILKTMGSSADAHQDMESPSTPGMRSALTDPIEDVKDVNAENFLDWAMEQSQSVGGGVLQPDGSVVEENSKLLGMLVTYRRHILDKDNDQLVTAEYGQDSTLTDKLADTFLKVHRNPFRLELYSVAVGGVRAGEPAKKTIEAIINSVFAKMAA